MIRNMRRRGTLTEMALAGTLAFGGLASATAPASAFFFGPYFAWGPPAYREASPMYRDAPPVYRESVIPPRFVAVILRGQGFRLAEPPVRRGSQIIALGTDERGQVMRFIIDAYDGAVLRTALVGAPRPPGFVGSRPNYAYATPDEAIPSRPVPNRLERPKPKVKTATKTPAPLPQAVPASPAAPPSRATRAPVTPVRPAPPPVAARPVQPAPPVAATPPVDPTPVGKTPPVTASAPNPPSAPETRPAPDAQPKDIGPRVVPVKPAEARVIDKPPPAADWDTEAAPRAVSPEEANKMAPERYKDEQN